MFRYETHLHSYPVSKCARTTVEEYLQFYAHHGYAGIFVTNHFVDGNINIAWDAPYEDKINFYFSDYELAKQLAPNYGLDVFCGLECSYNGTDFLVYGLDKEWFLAHPEIAAMTMKQKLQLYVDSGALVVHAHPFREAGYIDHIRLFPRQVHGVEVINAGRTDEENAIAKIYADFYGKVHLAGCDQHCLQMAGILAGIETPCRIKDEKHFIQLVLANEHSIFTVDLRK